MGDTSYTIRSTIIRDVPMLSANGWWFIPITIPQTLTNIAFVTYLVTVVRADGNFGKLDYNDYYCCFLIYTQLINGIISYRVIGGSANGGTAGIGMTSPPANTNITSNGSNVDWASLKPLTGRSLSSTNVTASFSLLIARNSVSAPSDRNYNIILSQLY